MSGERTTRTPAGTIDRSTAPAGTAHRSTAPDGTTGRQATPAGTIGRLTPRRSNRARTAHRSTPSRVDRARTAVARSVHLAFVLVALLAATIPVAACADGSGGSDGSAGREITVSAAASLTEAFTELTNEFIAANPGAVVRTNFGSSGQLAEQVIGGAPVDVVAFADNHTMDRLDDAGLIGPVRTFARNSMVIVTEPDNPKRIESISDLASPDVGIVSLCRTEAPCGTYADQILESAGVRLAASRITRGQDVKDTLGAVTNGDADAAIVYRTDAIAAHDQISMITIPEASNVSASYPIAVVERTGRSGPDTGTPGSAESDQMAADSTGSAAPSDGAAATGDPTVARTFVDFVLSGKGLAVLTESGFDAP